MKKISLLIVFVAMFFVSFSQKNIESVVEVKNTVPKDQAMTGTCWGFSTTSFIESEVLRITGKEFDLSENFVVYYTYMNKARIYFRFHGNHNFGQGGQAHDVINVVREYGIVPESAYEFKNKYHGKMEELLKNYLDSIIALKDVPKDWEKGFVAILNEQLGTPPTSFEFNGKTYTPMTFTNDVLHFKPDDYIEITSYKYKGFDKNIILEVPDNWSLDLYMNVNIDNFVKIVDYALKNNYSMVWDGDVSEKGFESKKGMADLKLENAEKKMTTDELRQAMFDNYTTTDDHLMHLVGIAKDKKDRKLYKIKNSWGEYPPFAGYLFVTEEYMKLKTVAIMVNKEVIQKIENE